MSSEPKTDAVSFRWVIIFLIWLANTCGALTQLSGGPVQLSVAKEFGLNAAQLATWINLPLLAIGLFSIPAGILVDRFGARAGVRSRCSSCPYSRSDEESLLALRGFVSRLSPSESVTLFC